MNLEELLATGRDIWGDEPMTLEHIAVCFAVIAGDLAREAREQHEHGNYNRRTVAKELGNAILSTVRWADDLDLNPEWCARLAIDTQRKYAAKEQVS